MIFINAHTHHLEKDENILSIYQATPLDAQLSSPFSISIHPWDIGKGFTMADVESKIHCKTCIAVGETGLDKLRPDYKEQIRFFIQHIQLAKAYKKPLIIHCVKAFDDCIAILKKEKFNGGVLFHGFNKHPQLALQLLKHGYFIGLGASFLKENHNFDRFLQEIELNQILFETDNQTDVSILDLYSRAQQLFPNLDVKQKMSNNFKNWKEK
ncbi:MAG: TatD family hydrolase [Flavobacteriales bacterium]